MSESGSKLIRRYLEDAIAAEKTFESELRAFAKEGDDEEVQTAFSVHADESLFQRERLAARLSELGNASSHMSERLASLFLDVAPHMVENGRIPEERIAQNLIVAYTMETGECGMYEALAVVAEAAGDLATEELARQIQREERMMADKIWHFLPSRSKIAFNMLTVNEIDPAVETKTGGNRLLEG